jgi:hypothetical protein
MYDIIFYIIEIDLMMNLMIFIGRLVILLKLCDFILPLFFSKRRLSLPLFRWKDLTVRCQFACEMTILPIVISGPHSLSFLL